MSEKIILISAFLYALREILVHRFRNNYTTHLSVQSDSQTSEWYSYLRSDVLVFRLLQVTPIQIGIALNWNLIITLKGRPAMV